MPGLTACVHDLYDFLIDAGAQIPGIRRILFNKAVCIGLEGYIIAGRLATALEKST
jgi:hypothetical protein